MQMNLWMGALAVGALAVGCGGSNNRYGNTSGGVGTSGANGPAMTLTGCVEQGTPAGTYVLKTAPSAQRTPGAAAGTSGSGTSGSASETRKTPRAGDERAGRTYRLIATGNMDLGANLGKQVSVTGQVANQAQETGTSGMNRERTRRPGESGEGDVGEPRSQPGQQATGVEFFRVTEMTKVGDSCSGGN